MILNYFSEIVPRTQKDYNAINLFFLCFLINLSTPRWLILITSLLINNITPIALKPITMKLFKHLENLNDIFNNFCTPTDEYPLPNTYEPINSEEYHPFLNLAPILAYNPDADLDELCASVA